MWEGVRAPKNARKHTLFTHTHRHTHTHRDRQTDRQTDRHTHTHTHTHSVGRVFTNGYIYIYICITRGTGSVGHGAQGQ